MARRETGKLTPAEISSLTKPDNFRPGMYGDGAGLYLNVGPSGGASWVFRFMLNGKAREMGLGPLHTIGLADARKRAKAARELRLDGTDPLEARKAEKARKVAEAAAAVTFRHAAETYISTNRSGWRNAKHAWQWSATLQAHVYPIIGDLPVAAVDTGHVTKILEPIWAAKPETAARVRGRIEAILDAAKVRGWRSGENPARWRGHLENVLPGRGKVAKVKHHAAMPWAEVGTFMAKLESQPGTARLALQFTILTAARTGETIGATWAEIDLDAAVWTVPASRMKAGVEFRVPLSAPAIAVLRQAAELRQGDTGDAPVFPGGKGGQSSKGLSNVAMLMLLRRMGQGALTTHGFRSAFRDWAAETTEYQREVVEAALAHTIESKVEAAYRRGDLFEKRRALMAEWARFCAGATKAASLAPSGVELATDGTAAPALASPQA